MRSSSTTRTRRRAPAEASDGEPMGSSLTDNPYAAITEDAPRGRFRPLARYVRMPPLVLRRVEHRLDARRQAVAPLAHARDLEPVHVLVELAPERRHRELAALLLAAERVPEEDAERGAEDRRAARDRRGAVRAAADQHRLRLLQVAVDLLAPLRLRL